jgi:dienelactone hydrolase
MQCIRDTKLLTRTGVVHVKSPFVVALTTAVMPLTLVAQGWQDSAPTTPGGPARTPIVSAVDAPAGTETLAVQWIKVSVPDVGVMMAAVARPSGTGPFPSVILLHGTHGFARQYVQLAKDLARNGLLAVAPCWFSGGGGPGAQFVTPPIPCPDAPALTAPGSPEAVRTVDALVRAVRSLPGVLPDRVGLFGHSRGSAATLSYIMGASDASVRAAVLESGGYPKEWADGAGQVKAPILILHGAGDTSVDGGSAFNTVEMARNFEAALKRAGKPVEAKYYQQGGHNAFFSDATQRDDEVRRMAAFYRRHLRR